MPDINARQKWSVLWPYLRVMPDSLRLLDAGCGNGSWALELAARKPSWYVTGLDKNVEAIRLATLAKEKLGLANVSFVCDDFLRYHPDGAYDVVLSVASAHYLVEEGRGIELFRAFRSWLRPDGRLLLLGPRCRDEVPAVNWLPMPMSKRRDVFSWQQLDLLCQDSGLCIESLRPAVFALGTIAKQISSLHDSTHVLGKLLYPLEWALDTSDRLFPLVQDKSAFWVMIARQNRASQCQ